MIRLLLPGLLAVLAVSGCHDGGRVEVQTTIVVGAAAQNASLAASAHWQVSGTSPGGVLDFTIDCNPSEDPDSVGVTLTASSPSLSLSPGSPARAGYLRVVGQVTPGALMVDVLSDGGPAHCQVSLKSATTACPMQVFRSINVDHNHVPTTTVPTSWEVFPVSGDHYPIWAPWNMSYPLAIRTGYLLHDLEHGGIVLSYKCVNALESAGCTQAQMDLDASRAAFGQRRTNNTPDPSQPSLYAARAWRWGLVADCYDSTEVAAFIAARFRHGREDIDSDYPAPFDPTQ